MSDVLSQITGIDEKFLKQEKLVQSASIAKRMSWAAHRTTTRPEDIAYCLMGILCVNMPLLYGEGGEWGRGVCLALLHCSDPRDYADSRYLCIFLKKLPGGDGRYTRTNISKTKEVSQLGEVETVYVPQRLVDLLESESILPHHVVHLRNVASLTPYRLLKVTGPVEIKLVPQTLTSNGEKGAQSTMDQLILVFATNKVADDLIRTCYIVLECLDPRATGLVIKLRYAPNITPYFDAAEITDLTCVPHQAFNSQLLPKPLGTTVELGNQQVLVSGRPEADSNGKYYMIDITASVIETPKPEPPPSPPKEKGFKSLFGFKG